MEHKTVSMKTGRFLLCALTTAKTSHFSHLISNSKHELILDSFVLFSWTCAQCTANNFIDLFCNKIDKIIFKMTSSSPAISVGWIVQHPFTYSQSQFNTSVSLEISVYASKITTCLLVVSTRKTVERSIRDIQCWILLIYLIRLALSLLLYLLKLPLGCWGLVWLEWEGVEKPHVDPQTINNHRPVYSRTLPLKCTLKSCLSVFQPT